MALERYLAVYIIVPIIKKKNVYHLTEITSYMYANLSYSENMSCVRRIETIIPTVDHLPISPYFLPLITVLG